MVPYCLICHAKMVQVPKTRGTYRCPKCDLRMTKAWKREKKRMVHELSKTRITAAEINEQINTELLRY